MYSNSDSNGGNDNSNNRQRQLYFLRLNSLASSSRSRSFWLQRIEAFSPVSLSCDRRVFLLRNASFSFRHLSLRCQMLAFNASSSVTVPAPQAAFKPIFSNDLLGDGGKTEEEEPDPGEMSGTSESSSAAVETKEAESQKTALGKSLFFSKSPEEEAH